MLSKNYLEMFMIRLKTLKIYQKFTELDFKTKIFMGLPAKQ